MRDYSNMPVLDWDGEETCYKAKAQILREEPVILMLPDTAVFELDAESVGCEVDAETGILYNCDPELVLGRLAEINHIDALRAVGEAAAESGSVVDVDAGGHRVIVHD